MKVALVPVAGAPGVGAPAPKRELCSQEGTSQKSEIRVQPQRGVGFSLVIHVGMEQAEAKYHTLFDAAGLRLRRIVHTQMEVSVIEGEIK